MNCRKARPVGNTAHVVCFHRFGRAISPYSKTDFVDNTFTTQTSIVRFIEDNWLDGQRIGGGSADAWTGSLNGMLDFAHPATPPLFLDPATGGHGSESS